MTDKNTNGRAMPNLMVESSSPQSNALRLGDYVPFFNTVYASTTYNTFGMNWNSHFEPDRITPSNPVSW